MKYSGLLVLLALFAVLRMFSVPRRNSLVARNHMLLGFANIGVVAVAAAIVVLFMTSNAHAQQSTTGKNSPIINGENGNVVINGNAVGGSVTITNNGVKTEWKDGKKFVNGKETQEEMVWPVGPEVRKERVTTKDMARVTGVIVDGAIFVHVRINDVNIPEGAYMIAPENIQKTVDFSIDRNNRLVINHRNSTLTGKVTVVVNAPQSLELIETSGATSVTSPVRGPKAMTIEASGASTVHISEGGTTMLNLHASGASKIMADNAIAGMVSINASGASTVTFRARDQVMGQASGAATTMSYGSPEHNTLKKSGAAKLLDIK